MQGSINLVLDILKSRKTSVWCFIYCDSSKWPSQQCLITLLWLGSTFHTQFWFLQGLSCLNYFRKYKYIFAFLNMDIVAQVVGNLPREDVDLWKTWTSFYTVSIMAAQVLVNQTARTSAAILSTFPKCSGLNSWWVHLTIGFIKSHSLEWLLCF